MMHQNQPQPGQPVAGNPPQLQKQVQKSAIKQGEKPITSNQMTVPGSALPNSLTPEMKQSVEDAQRLLKYIAKDGDSKLDPEVTRQLIQARYQATSGQWNSETETRFLISYDTLISHIYPVSLESINAIKPPPVSEHSQKRTRAEKAVHWYRHLTILALVILLMTQFYWLLGNNLLHDLNTLFKQREDISLQIARLDPVYQGSQPADPQNLSSTDKDLIELNRLKHEHAVLNQKLDSNLILLEFWNKIWLTGYQFKSELPPYLKKQYEARLNELQRYRQQTTDNTVATETQGHNISDNEIRTYNQSITSLELEKTRHQSRMLFFSNTLAAAFAIEILQSFVLPLLYGLLGAFIFVLRTLLLEIRSLTYTSDSDIRYRLRLTLGSLGGMIVGWFLKPDDMDTLTALSPMALAFLMGYNVDILFSIMDRFIESIKQWIDKPPEKASSPQKHVTKPD
ncbi:hypothetical protein [Oceanospirillum sediminis]|uniref:Uncharacterized protein n=1 Tax=Oceanospirillum sediminis TaxID=2760088 RepID=A0A839IRX0_9GAMM|nr:hypothetical protein [Oceanospirillum sediminis]MBB1487708.1 hypothetical protein [Oceanospirillum sediminis]